MVRLGIAAVTYIATILVAQVGWVVQAFAPLDLTTTLILGAVLVLIELSGPVIAERWRGGTPWHALHIAERYSLVVIITLGEGVVGTVATLGAVVAEVGWSMGAGLVAVCGIGVILGLWWVYFLLPSGPVLERHRERSFVWGYGHMLLFASVAFIGAGLHVVALLLESESHVPSVVVLAAVMVPVVLALFVTHALSACLTRSFPVPTVGMLAGSLVVAGLGFVVVRMGMPVTWALPLVALVPYVTVIGYGTVGHQRVAPAIEAVRND